MNFIHFYLNLANWLSGLKPLVDVSYEGVYLCFFLNFKEREINDKGRAIYGRRDVMSEGLVIIRDEA